MQERPEGTSAGIHRGALQVLIEALQRGSNHQERDGDSERRMGHHDAEARSNQAQACSETRNTQSR